MCERDLSDGGGVYGTGASFVLLAVGEEDTAVKVKTWQPARQLHETALVDSLVSKLISSSL